MSTINAVHSHILPQSIRSHRGNITILVVDDDACVLAILTAILEREGYSVISASSPKAALEIAAKETFDMLITDFQMPEWNGIQLASYLANSRFALPVLLMSGSDLCEIPMAEVSERHWNFISKPIDRERLLRIVDGECLSSAAQRNSLAQAS